MMSLTILRAATICVYLKVKYMESGRIILFQTQDGEAKIGVRFAYETGWLTAEQMAESFQRERSTILRGGLLRLRAGAQYKNRRAES